MLAAHSKRMCLYTLTIVDIPSETHRCQFKKKLLRSIVGWVERIPSKPQKVIEKPNFLYTRYINQIPSETQHYPTADTPR